MLRKQSPIEDTVLHLVESTSRTKFQSDQKVKQEHRRFAGEFKENNDNPININVCNKHVFPKFLFR